jgi:aspartate dehydrogenase
MKRRLKIAIVGCGAIGASLAQLLEKKFKKTAEVVAFCDLDNRKAQALQVKIKSGKAVALAEAIRLSDLVVEAASAKVSFTVAKRSLLKKRDVLVMSIGGILGKEKQLFEIAQKNNKRIYLPSGAICGLDGVSALAIAGIKRITLKTYKPPAALRGADYIVKNKVSLEKIKGQKVVFRGTASEAVRAFPQNINVVALLSLAARGLVVPQVEIIASARLKRNIHVISVESEAAHLEIRCENVPSPDNPKTSYLAILSAVRSIAGISEAVRIG